MAALLGILVPALVPAGSSAQASPEQAVVQAMFTSPTVDPSAFAASFTQQIPVATVQALIDGYRKRFGAVKSVGKAGDDYLVTFANGTVLTTIKLDGGGKIEGLRFHDETSPADTAAVEKVLSAEHVTADWFAPSFLAQITPAQLDTVLAQVRAQEGKFLSLEVRNGLYYAIYEKAENPVHVALDADGRIAALLLSPPVARTASRDDALAKLRAAAPQASYVILEGRTQVAALDADKPLAVGSAFKLAVLAALREQIAAGHSSWRDIVPLRAADKSLPSGTYQNWPDGAPITLDTYAAQMISISDNTAADALMHVVGKPALEALAPRNTPFLTTREMFALKSKDATSLRAEWRAGNVAQRRAILARIDAGPAPSLEQFDENPAYVDIEWYFSARELCALMARVQDLPLMTINPGFPKGAWKRVAFKGGSDIGALNLTSYVTAADGRSYCVAATFNDDRKPIDDSGAEAAYGAVLQQLSRR